MSTFVRPSWTGFGRAALLGVLFALAGAPADVSAQSVADKYQNRRSLADVPRARFSLHAEPAVVLEANQFQCGLVNTGDTCTDIFDSPTGGGGFWPTGSPNQYMFNSGIMIAGIISADAGFEWAGDTTGAYFMDARGTQQHGTPITNIYNSLDPADVAAWPTAGSIPGFPEATAYIVDEDIFSEVLTRGGPNGGPRATGSQQDTWVMYWDGDPGLSANRDHPMGVTIEQRTMAWNFPSGNEATIFIFYKITNVTNNETFQSMNELRYGIELPDGGWTFDDLYLAYDADPDVTTDATENFATVILPFNMGITYHALFQAAEFSYPPSLFYPPFFTQAPGIIGVQYLKSPEDPATGQEVGLTMFSVHENPGSCTGLCDPLGDKQLWRYISGNVTPGLGDPACSFSDPQTSRICYLPQTPADARFFQASGPFSLGAGESATIVVAMMAAATVNTPELTVGAENPPGIPGLQPGCGDDEILPIEIGAGWVSTPNQLCVDTPEGETINLRDVVTVPASLLGRAQVAQAVFDGKFLLPFAPEPPPFYLVPGDNQIVVIWDNSASENMEIDPVTGDTTGGDPFYNIASEEFTEGGDPNPLYNPNYRQFDVEGYRIYRSTDNANFELIAQFDYETTSFTDVRCEADRSYVPGEDTCADTTTYDINDVTDVNADFIDDPFVLFGGASAQRLRLIDERTLAIAGDSATTGDQPDLTDSGIPFAYIDTDVRNGFRYFYQVRAFDINSTFSGPITLESSSETKSAIPQAAALNQALASFTQEIVGADGTPIDPSQGYPAIDPANGTFQGPMPPTNTIEATFAPLVPRLLPQFTLTAQIDSARLGGGSTGYPCTSGTDQLGGCWNFFMTWNNSGTVTTSVATGYTPVWDAFGGAGFAEWLLGLTPVAADEASLVEFGVDVDEFDLDFNAAVQGGFDEQIFNSSAEGQLNRRAGTNSIPANVLDGGSRWFDGEAETEPDPARNIRVGHLSAVDTVWSPVHNTPVPSLGGANYPNGGVAQCYSYGVAGLARVADIRVTWTGGAVTVEDVTHHTPVPFMETGQTGYGFVRDGNGNGHIDWRDFDYIQGIGNSGTFRANAFCAAPTDAQLTTLSQTPVLDETSTSGAAAGSTVATGNGFGLYINAQRFIFETADGNPPADGTTWTLRTYHGYLTAATNPSVPGAPSADPSGYAFSPTGAGGLVDARPPMVPGLQIIFESLERTQLVGSSDLSLVHTVPDPYYAQSRYDLSPVEKALRFVNLPSQATIRIYTVSGLLVDIVNHNDPAGGGLATWDLKNRSGQFVASGVYFYHVSTPDGQERIGRFTVINSGIGQ